MFDKYVSLINRSKKIPNNRAHSYNVIRNMVQNLAKGLVDQENFVREELSLTPIEVFRVPADDETEEQRAEFKKKEIERKNEALKKSKKKPKTEDEEIQELDNLINKVSDHLSHNFINN